MIRIRDIDHIVLRVSDLMGMLRFYQQVLGCSLERRQDAIGLVQLRAGRSLVDLVPVDGPLGKAGGAAPGKEGRNVDHVCFRVEPFDAEALRRHLAAHGVEAGEVESRYGAEGEGPRSTSTTRKVTPWNSRVRPGPRSTSLKTAS